MDALDELESFALSAALDDAPTKGPNIETVHHYMDLLGLDEQEAITKPKELRGFIPEIQKPRSNRKPAVAYLVRLQGPYLLSRRYSLLSAYQSLLRLSRA